MRGGVPSICREGRKRDDLARFYVICLLVGAPVAPPASATAVVLNALVSIQSLYWTMLPRNTAPSDRLPLVILVCCHAAFWLALIGWYARKRDRD